MKTSLTKSFEFKLNSNDLVKDVFTKGGLSVVYGESNCGKTFFVTDLCFSITEGKDWRGKRVEAGAAVYVPLEGVNGIGGRIQAYKKENGTTLKDFYMMPSSFDFLDEGQDTHCLLYTSPSPRDGLLSRMPSSA